MQFRKRWKSCCVLWHKYGNQSTFWIADKISINSGESIWISLLFWSARCSNIFWFWRFKTIRRTRLESIRIKKRRILDDEVFVRFLFNSQACVISCPNNTAVTFSFNVRMKRSTGFWYWASGPAGQITMPWMERNSVKNSAFSTDPALHRIHFIFYPYWSANSMYSLRKST